MAALGPAGAETLRIATYNGEMTAKGPGLILAALTMGDDPKLLAVMQAIVRLNADILVLTGIDYDLSGKTLRALADQLGQQGLVYPFQMALRPNSGIATGLDLDNNGRFGEPRDAQGYGQFAGQAGIAVLSRHPIDTANAVNYSEFLWRDLPGNLMPQDTSPQIAAVQRLSSGGHWSVPVILDNGQPLSLLVFYATPPVFDGAEDRNGRRNHDEAAFWLRLLAGELPFAPPSPPFVVMGQSNLDPTDGEGLPDALDALLAHPALQDPRPMGNHDRSDPGHSGDPLLDTALYFPGPGGLRVEVILPSAELQVIGSGVLWPAGSDPFAATLALASRHRPVWVDVTQP